MNKIIFSAIIASLSYHCSGMSRYEPQIEAIPSKKDSPIQLELNKTFYRNGEPIKAALKTKGLTLEKDFQGVVLYAESTGDMEVIELEKVNENLFRSTATRTVTTDNQSKKFEKLDGKLNVTSSGIITASFYVNQKQFPKLGINIISDAALVKTRQITSPTQLPELKKLVEGNFNNPHRRGGALLVKGKSPVMVPSNELLFWPQSDSQLELFLKEPGVKILGKTPSRITSKSSNPSSLVSAKASDFLYRVSIDSNNIDTTYLKDLRKLYSENSEIYFSDGNMSKLYTQALALKLKGFYVSLNPRLEFNGDPRPRELEAGNLKASMKRQRWNTASLIACSDTADNCTLNVPDLWAYMALWDADEKEVPVAFLDMGFIGEHPDFRHPRDGSDLLECNFSDTLISGSPRCSSGAASSPPGVGNGLFGDRSWHGTGVVSVAGGEINNNWFPDGGGVGVGGQVIIPQLYKYDTASYVFEIGAGIRSAVNNRAACINISAGYPCNIQSSLLPDIDVCSAGGQAAFCLGVFAVLSASAAATCSSVALLAGIPIVGPILASAASTACAAQSATAVTFIPACSSFFIATGNVRGPMRSAVEYATRAGIPVVTSGGNVGVFEDMPRALRAIIDTSNSNIDDWGIIPAVIPGVISVGSVSTTSGPHLTNNNFYGDSITTWAPISSMYMSGNSERTLPAHSSEFMIDSLGGTSAAAPYVTGVIAAMQAINPSLNPNTPGLSENNRRRIVERIRSIISASAFYNNLPIDPNRRNLINPLGAVIMAGRDQVPNVRINASTLNINDNFGTEAAPVPLNVGSVIREAIVNYPAGINNGLAASIPQGVNSTDIDWFSLQLENENHFYQSQISLTIPSPNEFGWLKLVPENWSIARRTQRQNPDRSITITYLSDTQVGNTNLKFSVQGKNPMDDNTYKLEVEQVARSNSRPDRFDIDVLLNPARPNNSVPERSVILGNRGQFQWNLINRGLIDIYEIRINNLNFHNLVDHDWFTVQNLPQSLRRCRDFGPKLEVIADNDFKIKVSPTTSGDAGSLEDVSISRSSYDESRVYELGPSEQRFVLQRSNSASVDSEYDLIVRFHALRRGVGPGC